MLDLTLKNDDPSCFLDEKGRISLNPYNEGRLVLLDTLLLTLYSCMEYRISLQLF